MFDVVTLQGVVEHVISPSDLVQKAAAFLADGGWLVVETGNYKSAERVRRGTNHWIYQLDHRWHFSLESMRKVLSEAGFSEFIFSEKVLRPGWKGSVGYSGPSEKGLLKQIRRDPLGFSRYMSTYFALTKSKKVGNAGHWNFCRLCKKGEIRSGCRLMSSARTLCVELGGF